MRIANILRGHMGITPIKAIRKYCLWCCNNQTKEVELCPETRCPLQSLRHGRLVKGIKPLKSIRLRCIDCSGLSMKDVNSCKFGPDHINKCDLYQFRMGRNSK